MLIDQVDFSELKLVFEALELELCDEVIAPVTRYRYRVGALSRSIGGKASYHVQGSDAVCSVVLR